MLEYHIFNNNNVKRKGYFAIFNPAHFDSDYLHILFNISRLGGPRTTFHPLQETSVSGASNAVRGVSLLL